MNEFDEIRENEQEAPQEVAEPVEETENTEYNEPEVIEEPEASEEAESSDSLEGFFSEDIETDDAPVWNKVNYTDVSPMNDYKPMSRGLKLFAGIMVAVILLTSACVGGYFLGKNNN